MYHRRELLRKSRKIGLHAWVDLGFRSFADARLYITTHEPEGQDWSCGLGGWLGLRIEAVITVISGVYTSVELTKKSERSNAYARA